MSDRKGIPKFPDHLKAIVLAAILGIIFIINQVYYFVNRQPAETKGPGNSPPPAEYVYEDPHSTPRETVEERKTREVRELLGLKEEDAPLIQVELWDENTYFFAHPKATRVGEGSLMYAVEDGDGNLSLRKISWQESFLSHEGGTGDPMHLATLFVQSFFGLKDGMDESARTKAFSQVAENVDEILLHDICDPEFPVLGPRTVASVRTEVLRDESTFAVSFILSDGEDDHAPEYTIFSVYLTYDGNRWIITDMDVRKDGDASGLQDGYRLYE